MSDTGYTICTEKTIKRIPELQQQQQQGAMYSCAACAAAQQLLDQASHTYTTHATLATFGVTDSTFQYNQPIYLGTVLREAEMSMLPNTPSTTALPASDAKFCHMPPVDLLLLLSLLFPAFAAVLLFMALATCSMTRAATQQQHEVSISISNSSSA
jgi:hypothetical protein